MTSFFRLQLVSVLRETNHLQQLEREDIPESAQKLFERNDQLTLYVNNLNLIVQWYNKVHRMALDVEKPLIKDELAEIDKVLTKAENNLNWNSPGKVHDHLPPALNLLTSSLYKLVFFVYRGVGVHRGDAREGARLRAAHAEVQGQRDGNPAHHGHVEVTSAARAQDREARGAA